MLTEALEHLVKGIVDHPDDVVVRQRSDRRHREKGDQRTFEVRVHPDDMGRVIGRMGRTARAVRTVINAINGGQPVRVDFIGPDGR